MADEILVTDGKPKIPEPSEVLVKLSAQLLVPSEPGIKHEVEFMLFVVRRSLAHPEGIDLDRSLFKITFEGLEMLYRYADVDATRVAVLKSHTPDSLFEALVKEIKHESKDSCENHSAPCNEVHQRGIASD